MYRVRRGKGCKNLVNADFTTVFFLLEILNAKETYKTGEIDGRIQMSVSALMQKER